MEKIKYKKIRGKNRRLRDIEDWVKCNEQLDLNSLKEYQRDYVKFWVNPWLRLTFTNSVYPEPTGIFQQKFIAGLGQIYDNWQAQLDESGEAYYLKIWLFPSELSHSQIVCAVGKRLNFYDNSFEIVENSLVCDMDLDLSVDEKQILEKFNWQKCLDYHCETPRYMWLGDKREKK